MGKRKSRKLRNAPTPGRMLPTPNPPQKGDFVLFQKIWPVRIRKVYAAAGPAYIVYSRSDNALYKTTQVDLMESIDWKNLAQSDQDVDTDNGDAEDMDVDEFGDENVGDRGAGKEDMADETLDDEDIGVDSCKENVCDRGAGKEDVADEALDDEDIGVDSCKENVGDRGAGKEDVADEALDDEDIGVDSCKENVGDRGAGKEDVADEALDDEDIVVDLCKENVCDRGAGKEDVADEALDDEDIGVDSCKENVGDRGAGKEDMADEALDDEDIGVDSCKENVCDRGAGKEDVADEALDDEDIVVDLCKENVGDTGAGKEDVADEALDDEDIGVDLCKENVCDRNAGKEDVADEALDDEDIGVDLCKENVCDRNEGKEDVADEASDDEDIGVDLCEENVGDEDIGSESRGGEDVGNDDVDGNECDVGESKCCFDELDDDYIDRDENHRRIYVRKQLKSDVTQTGIKKKTDRVYNNYHCCFLCRKHTTNILKHLRSHKDNEETREIVEMRKAIDAGNAKDKDIILKKQDLTRKQVLLRCRGDHQHNMDVKAADCGELIIARKHGQFKVEDYGPCPLCLEWIRIESFSKKHQTYCAGRRKDVDMSQKLTKGEAITRSAVLVGLVSEKASKTLLSEVYPIMTRDEITEIAKGDPLIVGLGNNWLQRNLANKLKRKYYTSSRMRGAARLLSHLHDLSAKKLQMTDYIKPTYFDTVCEAALLCASVDCDDELDLASPSSALKIGFDIGRLTQLKLGIAIREGNKTMKDESEQFSCLIKMEWTLKVSKLAHLKLNQMKLSKSSPLPVPEDLSSISKHLKTGLEALDFSLHSTDQTSVVYKRAVVLTQTRLLTYNKRRSGELEALSMENYENRSVGLDEADRALLGSELTDLEKHLIDSQQLIKIRGKNSKPVPILVPGDAVPALEYITSPNVRRAAGVKTWNKFVFANAGESVFRAYDSLKTICGELSLSAPERITSVSMRKYIATLSQVIDMKEHELEWLCNHLGHTADIHKLHYRATSGFIERVNIGKLMLLQDLNIAGKFAGQRLQDIDIVDVVKGAPPSRRRDEPQNTAVLDEDVFEDESTNKNNSSSTRQKWSKQEEEELKRLFYQQINKKKNPGIRDCMAAIEKSRKQKGLVYLRNWETIKKKVMRIIAKAN